MEFIRRIWRDERGEDLTEYALIVGLVAIIAIVGVSALGTGLDAWYAGLASWVGTIGAPAV